MKLKKSDSHDKASGNAVMEMIKDFFEAVVDCGGNETLYLEFKSCRSVNDAVVEELAVQLVSRVNNITKLTLDIHEGNITHDAVKKFAVQLGKNLSNLETLSLDIQGL